MSRKKNKNKQSPFTVYIHRDKDKGPNRVLHDADEAMRYFRKRFIEWNNADVDFVVKIKHNPSNLVYCSKDVANLETFVNNVVNGRKH